MSQKNKTAKKEKLSLSVLLGENRLAKITTVIGFVFSCVWEIVYIICTIDRAAKFDKAQAQAQLILAQTGQLSYTVSVDSPLYAILKYALLLVPVLSILWAIAVYRGDKKQTIPDKRLLIVLIALFVVVCFTALLDVARLHLILT